MKLIQPEILVCARLFSGFGKPLFLQDAAGEWGVRPSVAHKMIGTDVALQ